MKAMIRISPPHRAHTSGSTSYTRLIISAQRRRCLLRSRDYQSITGGGALPTHQQTRATASTRSSWVPSRQTPLVSCDLPPDQNSTAPGVHHRRGIRDLGDGKPLTVLGGY